MHIFKVTPGSHRDLGLSLACKQHSRSQHSSHVQLGQQHVNSMDGFGFTPCCYRYLGLLPACKQKAAQHMCMIGQQHITGIHILKVTPACHTKPSSQHRTEAGTSCCSSSRCSKRSIRHYMWVETPADPIYQVLLPWCQQVRLSPPTPRCLQGCEYLHPPAPRRPTPWAPQAPLTPSMSMVATSQSACLCHSHMGCEAPASLIHIHLTPLAAEV